MKDTPAGAAQVEERSADPKSAPSTRPLNSTPVWVPDGWARNQNGFLVPASLAGIEEPSPLELLLAEKIRETPSWSAALDKWAAVATSVVNVAVRFVEATAPVVEQASQVIARVTASPKTVEVLETFVGLMLFAEEVEAEGGDLDAFVLVTARAGLGRAGVKPDARLRVILRDLGRRQGGEITLRYLIDLINHHRNRLLRPAEVERIEKEKLLIRKGIKKFSSVDIALKALALEGQGHEQVLNDMIPGIAYLEKSASLDNQLPGKVANQIRREGVERPDALGKVVTMEPEFVLERALQQVDELELTAFAERELAAKKMHDAGLSQQELESFTFGTFFGNKEAARILGRPANQVGVEKGRALDKLRFALGS